jgi:hypothetical protein
MFLTGLEVFLLGFLPMLGLLWGIQTCLTNLPLSRLIQKPTILEIYAITLIGAAMLISTFSYSTSYHVSINGWPTYLLAFLGLQSWLRHLRSPKASILIAGGLILVMTFGVATRLISYAVLWTNPACWQNSYGTVEKRLFSSAGPDNAYIQNIVIEASRALTPNQQPIFVYSASPQLYLLANRLPASRYLFVYPIYMNAEQQAVMQHELLIAQPPVIINDSKSGTALLKDLRFRKYSTQQLQLKNLEHFVHSRYHPILMAGPYTLCQKNDKN